MTAQAAEPSAELRYDDDHLRQILKSVRVIAMVGASANWVRPSNFAMKYLQGKGFRVIPVNPGAAGQTIWGETVHASLADIPDRFDMVDIFRSSDAAGPIVDEAIKLAPAKGTRVIWMQIGVRNDAAAARAEKAGLTVVMNRCPKIEYGRLFGELSWSGVNSGIVSAKRPRMRP
ncbi:MAG: CoA-binding protein [Rhodospirillales bacterium]|nr:CoA-binding protein [Rhodospirillales bacterium]